MPELLSIRVTAEPEQDPLLDYLGEFSDEPGPRERTIDRADKGVFNSGEYRYFIAAHGPEETGNPDSVEEDWRRMENYGDTWWHLHIRAEATISAGGIQQTVRSVGLGGVASDSPDDYLHEVAQQEVAQLREVLADLGVEADATPEWADDAPVSGPVEEGEPA